MVNLTHADLIDGDQFEALARRLGLAYVELHELKRDALRGVVLSHNSDGCIVPPRPDGPPYREYDFVWQNIPPEVRHWFGQNIDVRDERLTPLPIGLERVRWYPQLHKHDVILSTPHARERKLCYLNANTRIVGQREALYQRFGGQDWVTSERGQNGLDFPHYAYQLTSHKFVLCPDGNGLDTHRTWEALYLGAFPVVQRHVFTEYFAQYLPMLIVDDWAEVTSDYLEATYARFNARPWDWEVLTMDYWEKLIRSCL